MEKKIMGRPHKCGKFSSFNPPYNYFIPQGTQDQNIGNVFLTEEELNAIKIYHYEIKNQVLAAEKMNISQATFSRLLTRAYDKMAKALIEGLGIGIISHRRHWGWQNNSINQTNSEFSKSEINITDPDDLIQKQVSTEKKSENCFYGYACLDCGFEWKSSQEDQKKIGNSPCPQCKSQKTYKLIKNY